MYLGVPGGRERAGGGTATISRDGHRPQGVPTSPGGRRDDWSPW